MNRPASNLHTVAKLDRNDDAMSTKTTNAKKTSTSKMKQMKLFLTIQEHTVVTAAANMKGMNVGDYMKLAVIEQAKKDAKEMNKIIDSI